MSYKWIILILTLLNTLAAQTSTFEENPGYIYISADTIGVPIYIDGSLIGHTPFGESPSSFARNSSYHTSSTIHSRSIYTIWTDK